MKRFQTIMLAILFLPRTICVHLVGEQHSHYHHMIVGVVMMVIGVVIAKNSADLLGGAFIHYAGDIFGYAIHGIGSIPFGEAVSRNARL